MVLAALALFLTLTRPTDHGAAPHKETAFERVVRTNTLRCGYGVFAPYFMKDPITGAFSGIWHDFAEETGSMLGVKIEWVEEIGLDDIGIALDTKRVDAYCSALWVAGKRARSVNFLSPSAFEPMLAYVRVKDHRFDKDLKSLNDAQVGVSTMDSEGGGFIAQEDFPKAKQVSLPHLSGYPDMFKQVATGKADVVIAAPSGAMAYLKNNQGELRPLADKPLRTFPISAFVVGYGQDALREALETAQKSVLVNGTMEKILQRYEPFPGAFLRVAKPYAENQGNVP